MNENDYEVLNEIYKGAKMGMESITYLKDNVNNNTLRDEVNKQYEEYKKVSEDLENIFKSNNKELKDIAKKDKLTGWTSVKINTIKDSSPSHISEMLIEGNLMGIIEGTKLSNHNPDLQVDTKNIVNTFVKTGEDNIESLKKFL